MGMYDSIMIHPPCPKCGKKARDLQTKSLLKGLKEYKVGDSVSNDYNSYHIEDGWISGCEICGKCKKFFECKIYITDNKISGKWKYIAEYRNGKKIKS